MEFVEHLLLGMSVAFSWQNIWYCILGCVIGTLVGLLPGLGPVATISMLLPITYHMPAASSIIMLAGIYYGAQFGDSVSAITMKIPHTTSIITCIDGYQMHLHGKTGLALFTAGFSSFIGGTIAVLIVGAFAPTLGNLAFILGPAEYCLLILLGFASISLVVAKDILRGTAMVLIGIIVALIGTNISSGLPRFTFNVDDLLNGVGIVSIALGCFGVAELVVNLNQKNIQSPFNGKIDFTITLDDLKRILPSAVRGSLIGSALGVMPGGGPVIAQYGGYAVEKKFSKNKEQIGNGSIEGVAGPCAADEAAARTSFIPLMSVGIPENAVTALLLGALMIQGIQPGPSFISKHPDIFWGLIVSMWIGGVFLFILNVPLVRFLLSALHIPYNVLFPCILFFCCVGSLGVTGSLIGVYLTAIFSIVGYLFLVLGLESFLLILGFILGPMFEEYFRRQMIISKGNLYSFVDQPIGMVLFATLVIVIVYGIVKGHKNDIYVSTN